MEFGIKKINYEVLEGTNIVHSGECPSFLLNTLSDIYCDFENSTYSLRIKIEDKEFTAAAPEIK